MRRPVIAVLALATLSAACRPKGAETTAPINLATDHILADGADVQVDVGYRAAPERELEIVVALKAIGIEEMDRIVVDIVTDGFVLVGGQPEWSGFVAPRIPITHRVSFRLLDGAEAGTLTVKVQRSANSEVLFEAQLRFAADGERVVPVDDA